jgi:serine/threonine protein kinase
MLLEDTPGGVCAVCVAKSPSTEILPLAGHDTTTATFFTHNDSPDGLASHDLPTRSDPKSQGFSLTEQEISALVSRSLEPRRRIDAGGMGDVYQAYERSTQRLVAVKFIRSHTNDSARERFVREIRIQAELRHPHIVQLYSADIHGPAPYFVMEWINGGSLNDLIGESQSARKPIPIDLAVQLLELAARAIQAAHDRQLCHRDLKPSNILIEKCDPLRSETWLPKIADFGLARNLEQPDNPTTHLGSVIGTPGYMAPEQALGRSDETNERTDVYGLGATLFAALTNQPPFPASRHAIQQIVTDPPPLPRSLRREIPLELEAICVKALEKRPEDRYSSAAELADDLQRFRTGQPTLVRPEGFWARRRRSVRKIPRSTAMALVVCVLLFVLMGAILIWPQPEPTLQSALSNFAVPPDVRPAQELVLEEIQTALRSNRTALLLNSDGTPKLPQWHLGATSLGSYSPADSACTFESIYMSFLSLCPDPGIDRYRFRVDIRRNATRAASVPKPEDAEAKGAYVGLFCGFQATPATPPLSALQNLFTLAYHDYVPFNTQTIPPRLYFRNMMILYTPSGRDPFVQSQLGTLELDAVASLPGPWRTLEVEVSPDEIRSYLVEGGVKKLVCQMIGDELIDAYRGGKESIAGTTQDLPHPPPPLWKSRLPLGIYCRLASLSFKNAILEPLTPSE